MRAGEGKAYAAGIGLALLFGCSFLAAKVALASYAQEAMLAVRFTLAATVLWSLAALRIASVDLAGKPWWKLVVLSLIYPTLSFALEAQGVDLLPSSQAGVIMSLMPVIALVLGRIVLRERVTAAQAAMVIVSVAGVAVLAAGQAAEGGATFAGVALMLGSATCGAIQAIAARSLSRTFSAIEVTCVMSFVAAVVFDIRLALAGAVGLSVLLPTAEGFLAVTYLALGCSVGAFFCLNYVNSALPVARASVFTNLSTAVSVLAGVALGGDRLSWERLAGMALVVAGVWGANRFSSVRTSAVSEQGGEG